MILLLMACGPEAPPLMAGLDGEWDAAFSVVDGAPERAGALDLVWDEEDGVLDGEITMVDPDGERRYQVLGAEDIEQLGVALQLVESAGVRQLFVETAAPDRDEVIGGWRTRWGCERGMCGEDGGLVISR
jgi:hypothetical protein